MSIEPLRIPEDMVAADLIPERLPEPRWLAPMEWTGTALQIAGAALIASRFQAPIDGYLTMLPGALIWLAVGIYRPNWALALMQSAFVAINILGILMWME